MPPQDQDDEPLISSKRKSHYGYSTMEKVDPHEPIRRPSVFKRESFIVQFTAGRGPPQIVAMVILYAIGFGSTVGIVPAIMSDRFARLNHDYTGEDCSSFDVFEKPQECLDGSTDARNASATASLISNTFTLLMSSLMGSISDSQGRRGLVLLGMSLSSLAPFALLCCHLKANSSPYWYYGAHSISGLVSWMAVSISALSDVMPPEWRAPSVGLLMAGMMLGISIAPSLALFLDTIHTMIVSVFSVCMALVIAFFFFPETLPPHVREEALKRQEEEYAGRSGVLEKTIWAVTRPIREMAILNRNSFFRLLSSLAFFSGMVSSGDQGLLIYYVEERLGFDASDVAFLFLVVGGLGFLTQVLVLKPLNDFIGERLVVVVCFVISTIHNTMYGLAQNKTEIYTAASLGALTMMSYPTISAIKANNVKESEQGRIQGALYSLQAVASGIGPVSMQWVDHLTKKNPFFPPGTMFLFGACVQMIAVGFAWALPADKANSRNSQPANGSLLSDSFIESLDWTEEDEEEPSQSA